MEQPGLCEHGTDSNLSRPQAKSFSPEVVRLPCGSRRCFVVVFYSIYAFLTGAAYFNWSPMADMLYKNGAFQWTCSSDELHRFRLSEETQTRPRCMAQELAVGRLFSAMSASEFGFAACAGLLFDSLGPKLTATLGTLMALGGWILLAVGTKGLDTLLVAAVLLGGSSEMCFYPLLPAADLYPGREGTIMAIFGTFRSISLIIPLVMRAVYVGAGVSSFRCIVLGFSCVCVAGCLLFALLFIPWKPWLRQERQGADAVLKVEKAGQALQSKGKTEERFKEEEFEPRSRETEGKEGSAIFKGLEIEPKLEERETETDKRTEEVVQWRGSWFREGTFLRELCSPAFGLMAAAYACVVMDIMFFIPSTLHLIPTAYAANQILQVFSFLPCPVLGYAADRIGILWVMHLVNLFGFLTYFFAVFPTIPSFAAMQFLSAIFCALQVSFMSSQLYCYGNKYLSQRNLGKLIGTAFCFAGFISLSTNPMRKHALERGFGAMCGVAMGLSAFAALLLAILQLLDCMHLLHRKKAARLASETEKVETKKVEQDYQEYTDAEEP